MSQGKPISGAEALAVAARVVDLLGPACERVRVAGSLRRRKAFVSDIEIVAEPAFRAEGLWSDVQVDRLDERIGQLLDAGEFEARQVETHRADGSVEHVTKLGPAYKALVAEGMPLDLFVVRPPATWGVIFALRTGPGDWNIRLVEECKAIGRRVAGGQVEGWNGSIGRWEVIPTPEEEDFFAAIGQEWIEPADRRRDRVRIRREAVPRAAAPPGRCD